MSIFINTEDIIDIEELEVALIKNEETAKKIKAEIKKLKEIKSCCNSSKIVEPIIKLSEQIEQEENDNNEYLYYYEAIKDVKLDIMDSDLKQLIRENLPSKGHVNYFKIVGRIKAEIYRELMTFDELSKGESDLDLLKEIKMYVDFLDKKIKFINEIEAEKISHKECEIENNIVFLETNSGNIYAFNDLESIDHEYYDSFKELYDSIKNGTFKNAKRFNSANNKNKTLCEVKGFKTRIFFTRLNKNTYIILQLLVKKCNNDKLYKESSINRFSVFRNNEEQILNKLNDSNYILKNKELANDFEDLLSNKIKKRGK